METVHCANCPREVPKNQSYTLRNIVAALLEPTPRALAESKGPFCSGCARNVLKMVDIALQVRMEAELKIQPYPLRGD